MAACAGTELARVQTGGEKLNSGEFSYRQESFPRPGRPACFYERQNENQKILEFLATNVGIVGAPLEKPAESAL
jgi:hypothetical protein